MKLLLAFFLGLASTGWGAYASGTQSLHYFENNLADELGARPCTLGNAAVSYQTTPTPPQGSYWVGRFSGTSYLNNTLTAAAMASAGFWAVEFYVNLSVTTGSNVAISTPIMWFDFNAGNMSWVQSGQATLTTSGMTFLTGTTYLVDVTWDGTTRRVYVDNVSRGSSATAGGWDVTGTNLKIGELYVPNIGAACNCIVDKVRFMKFTTAAQVPTSFPISDGAATASSRGVRSPWDTGMPSPMIQEPEFGDGP